jgi:glucose/mannose transport system permease protein
VLSLTGQQDAALLQFGSGLSNYSKLCSICRTGWRADLESRDLRLALHRDLLGAGAGLAILLDQKIRGEGVLRPIYLYPMALSFIVTGTPGNGSSIPASALKTCDAPLGLGKLLLHAGSRIATGDLHHRDRRVWQSSGFVMAMFLAGLRGVDNEIIKAAQIDGAST